MIKKQTFLKSFLLLAITLLTIKVKSQTVTVRADNLAPFTLTRSAFLDMKQAVIMAKGHDEKIHRYTGVPLSDILAKAGVTLGDEAKRKTVMTYLIITAADNYKTIFSLAEIDPLFANRSIILADKQDKKVLPEGVGPFQVIAPGDKKHARWIRQVTSIELVVVK